MFRYDKELHTRRYPIDMKEYCDANNLSIDAVAKDVFELAPKHIKQELEGNVEAVLDEYWSYYKRVVFEI